MKDNTVIFLIVGLLSIQCTCRPKGQMKTEMDSLPTLDTINLYYNDNLSESLGTVFFLEVGDYRKISISLFSATREDSVYFGDFISHIESSRLSDTIKIVSRERQVPNLSKVDSSLARYLAVNHNHNDGLDVFYVIESIYSSGKRDTLSLGRLASDGIYHADQSYLSSDNGLHRSMLKVLISKDPAWASENVYSLDRALFSDD